MIERLWRSDRDWIMKIITWNIHGAQNDSAVWDVLLNFHPDIVLLQEVGAFPAQLADTFDKFRLIDREDLRYVYHAFVRKVGLASLQKHIAGRLLTRAAQSEPRPLRERWPKRLYF